MTKDFKLGKWLVSVSEGTISHCDELHRLEPKTLSVLLVLAQAKGDVVSREQLLDLVWHEQVVGDYVINSCIAALRKALGDDRKENQFIQTISKKGYKLVVDVQWIEEAVQSVDNMIRPQLQTPNSSTAFNWQSSKAYIISFLILLSVALLLLNRFGFNSLPNDAGKSPSTEFSIAVLPFVTFSDDPQLTYFADGLAEEMLHQLVTNQKLKVMSRSASFRYRDSEKELAVIAEELNVKYLIEGSVRLYKGQYKITIQLINAQSNFHLWSRVFDDSTGEIFKIQHQVGVAVSDMLNINEATKTTLPMRRHPESEQAYKYFIMAQSYMKIATGDAYEEALILYTKAVALSPDYALAYTGMASAYLLIHAYSYNDLVVATTQAKIALDKAQGLDPNQPEAFVVRGMMYTYLRQLDKAEESYKRALVLNPNLRFAHHNYAYMLTIQSRYEESLVHSSIALEMDPLSRNVIFLVGDALSGLAYYDKALAHFTHCNKMLPTMKGCYMGLASLHQLYNNIDKAIYHMEQLGLDSNNNFFYLRTYASLLVHQGKYVEANELLNKAIAFNSIDYFSLRTQWLLALATDNLKEFDQSLNDLAKENPNNMDVKRFQAVCAYWLGDYQSVISFYETSQTDSNNFMFDLWDYADGLSHAIYLAESYGQTGQQEKKQKLLLEIEHHLNSFSERIEQVPGALYVKAKYDSLIGNDNSSKTIIKKLNHNWALSWLIKKDPFWTN